MIQTVFWDYLLRQLSADIRERTELMQWLCSSSTIGNEYESEQCFNSETQIQSDLQTNESVN
jgi:hypothetical protein